MAAAAQRLASWLGPSHAPPPAARLAPARSPAPHRCSTRHMSESHSESLATGLDSKTLL